MKKILEICLLLLIVSKIEAQTSVFSNVDELLLKGSYQKALSLLQNTEPKSAKTLDKIAGIYEKIGDYNRSIIYYKESLKLEDKEPVKVKLGHIYKLAGFVSKSIEIYESIVKKNAHNSLTINSLGKLYLLNNKPNKAEELYKILIERDSLNPDYSYQLGQSFKKQREIFPAGQCFLDAFNKDTLHLKSIYELVKFYKSLKFKDSTTLFIDKGLKIDSNNINFNQLKANELYFEKQFQKALFYLDRLDSLNYRSVNTYEMSGMCYLNLNKNELAEKYFLKALKLEFNNPKILYRLGALKYEMKAYKRANLYLLESIIYSKPDLDKQYVLLGIINKEAGDLKMAIDYFDKAVKNNLKNRTALFEFALASDAYYKDKKIALRLYQNYLVRFKNKDKEQVNFCEERIKEIKKQLFVKGEKID